MHVVDRAVHCTQMLSFSVLAVTALGTSVLLFYLSVCFVIFDTFHAGLCRNISLVSFFIFKPVNKQPVVHPWKTEPVSCAMLLHVLLECLSSVQRYHLHCKDLYFIPHSEKNILLQARKTHRENMRTEVFLSLFQKKKKK